MSSEDLTKAEGWVSFWDLSYSDGSYLEYWEAKEIPVELVELAESGQLAPGSSVLDIGCGAGLEALYLAGRGCKVIGLDSSRQALAQARIRQAELKHSEGLDIEWIEGNALSLPVESSSIDWALDRGCLHCIDHEERHRYAKDVGRVLRPGGLLLLRGARKDDDEQGLVGITAEELDELFPTDQFLRGPVLPISLKARAGSLAAIMVRIQRETMPTGP